MRQRIIVLLTFISFLSCNAFSQDVWLQNYFSPSSGCGLTNTELVNVLINNNSGVVMPSNSINVSYTIDGGSLTQQLLNSNLFPGASWNFNFNVNANLSGCGSHVVKVWVTRAGDVVHTNDTLQWTIVNDCPVIPGAIQNDTTVCAVGNSGTLTLGGWTNGFILAWEYSIDNGATWVTTSTTGLTYNFSNLTQETLYHVVIDGASCSKDTSGVATVSLQTLPVPGTLTGSDSLCINSVSGAINVSGASGPPLHWEYSSNNGASWNITPNPSTTQNYSALLTSTLYRVYTDGGACPDIYSDTALIYIEQLTDPATLVGSDSLCITASSGTIQATGNIGDVLFWQYSINSGTSWTPIGNSTTTQNYTNLPVTTWYRTFTDGGFCPSYFSDTAIIFVQPTPLQPHLSGNDSLCASNASGTITMVGPPSTILHWESSSNNGSSWTTIANTTTTLNYSGLTTTTLYRLLADGGVCNDIYSDTVKIFVQAVTDPGHITGSDSVCSPAFGFLIITGNTGPVSYWEFSDDYGATWNLINNTATIQNYSLTESSWFRAYTLGGQCPSYYTDTAVVAVDDPLIPGIIEGSDTICGMTPGGTLIYSAGTGNIVRWEISLDQGNSWFSVFNTSNALNYTNVSTTTYYRVLKGGSICGNVYSEIAIVMIVPPTDAGILSSDHLLCVGDSFELGLVGYTADQFDWESSVDGINWTPLPGVNSPTYMATNVTSDTWYQVIVESGDCGADTTNSATIFALQAPIINAGQDVTITEGDTTLLIAIGGGTGVWFPGLTLSDSLIPTPLAFPLVTTTYVYSLVDGNGCENEDSVTVFVNPATYLDIKNVITANHDGYNDTWIIEGVELFPSTFVVVFNIYGKEVYSSDDYKNDWMGTYKEKQLPNGTYYYTVVPGGTEKQLKGNLTIMGDE